MHRKVISVLALGVVAAFLITLVVAHLSIWFLWELLPPPSHGPPGTIQIAINQKYPTASFFIHHLTATSLAPALTPLASASLFAISQTPASTTLVAIPDNPFLFRDRRSLTKQLREAGFRTERLGLLIIAQQGNSDEPADIVRASLGQAARQTARRLLSSTLSARPFLIASADAGTIPFLDNSLIVIGTAKGNDVQLITAEQTINFHTTDLIAPPLPKDADELKLALPSHVLATIPDALNRIWNNALLDRLGFTNTQPDIMNHLAQYDSLVIQLTKNDVTIALAGNQELFTSTVKIWLQAEEAYTRQRQRVFRLPDGTLGYEQVPGEIREVFSNSVDANCRHEAYPRLADAADTGRPVRGPDMKNFWLCAKDNQVVLSSNYATAQTAIQEPPPTPGNWYVTLGSQHLADLALPLQAAAASGTDTQAIIHFRITP